MIDVEIHVPTALPPEQVEAARRRIAALDRYVSAPLLGARMTLRRDGSAANKAAYVADVDVRFDGRVLAAHGNGRTATEAADLAAQALRRQVRRIVGADVALRNEPRVFEALGREDRPRPRLKPAEERSIVARRSYAQEPEPTLTAIADMLQDAEDFHLFVHARTGEDVLVYWLDAGKIGLLFPPGSVLGDESDIVVAHPSWFSEPLSLATAREEMDMLNERAVNNRFLYFIDAADDRGKVIYVRLDGDYGLVEPAP
jgi:ribosome-associated translation inhibitor RaiA